MLNMEHVPGKDVGKITLFALSTCGWCAKTKKFLDKLGVEYSYIYADLLPEADSEELKQELSRWNPQESFPTIVIKDKPVLGYDRDRILETIG